MPRNSKNKNEAKDRFGMLKNLDLFPRSLPSFNLQGKHSIRTLWGSLITVLIVLVTILFASIKLQQLLLHENPTVNSNKIKEYYLPEDKVSLTSQGDNGKFNIAFAVENYFTRANLVDPRYVKLAAYLYK